MRGNGNGIIHKEGPGRLDTQPASEPDWSAFWSWVDQRIASALDARSLVETEGTGQAIGQVRAQLRREMERLAELRNAHAAEVKALRSEITSLRTLFAQERRFDGLQREAAARDVALVHLQRDLAELTQRLGPLLR
jgi:chromosome segregation ATPase